MADHQWDALVEGRYKDVGSERDHQVHRSVEGRLDVLLQEAMTLKDTVQHQFDLLAR